MKISYSMKKQQPLKFLSIDEFLDYLPEEEREIVEILRELILDSLPQLEERLAYNVPYYYGRSRICFIWPASVPWGKVPAQGVQLGFCKGHLLQDEIEFLQKGNRKEVYVKTFFQPEEIDADLVKAYLMEAGEVDGG
jgi:hypothetical protein